MVKIMFKKIIKHTPIYNALIWIKQRKDVYDWKKNGKPVPPPPLIKQRVVKKYAKCFEKDVLIETGTCEGNMVYAMKNNFKKIFSVEIDNNLFKQAKQRFTNYPHIHIVHGDSGKVLPQILNSLSESCLFWLDAHYSGGTTGRGEKETPIMKELQYILNHSIDNHVILIDDARCFTGQNDYPTIKELRDYLLRKSPSLIFEIKNDIIRIYKKFEK